MSNVSDEFSDSNDSCKIDTSQLGRLVNKANVTSKFWKYFKVFEKDKNIAQCCIGDCKSVIRINDGSTSHLKSHLQSSKHRALFKDEKEQDLRKEYDRHEAQTEADNTCGQKRTIDGFYSVHHAPSFGRNVVMWIAMTYQALSVVTDYFFRQMCLSLNPKAEKEVNMGQEKLKELIINQSAEVKVKLERLLKTQMFSTTMDGWTSNQSISYLGVTIHWIDEQWKLRSTALGCFAKSGTSKAVDYLHECKRVLDKFGLNFASFVGIVTDTEATMNSFGRLITAESLQMGGGLSWHGCFCHLIELTTGIAFDDTPHSDNTMKAARALVGHFSHSTQANDLLLRIQTSLGIQRAISVIQDVATRWWSTYQMCKRLLELKQYIELMRAQDNINPSLMLSETQWTVIKEVTKLLEPFMVVQQMMEGEKYVTISLVPYLVWKVRDHLQRIDTADEGEDISEHVRTVTKKMLEDFNARWGTGVEGTVFNDHLTQGNDRNRVKGLTKLQMFAAFLDPRMKKLSPFIPSQDKQLLRSAFREYVIAVELDKVPLPAQAPPNQVQPPLNRRRREGVVAARHREDVAGIMRDLDVDDEDEEDQQPLLNAPVMDRDAVAATVDAQLSRYEREPKLPFWDAMDDNGMPAEGATYSDPLLWWKNKEVLFPALAPLARAILAIPASSAPAERLFSHAGLTIAKDRCRLTPDVAADLIFLHDAYPLVYPQLMPRNPYQYL
jgi:hypothetical protein